jgi:hypothetical protein
VVWDSIVGIRIKTCVAYKMDPVQQISIQQKLLDRLSIQTSIMDTGTHTFCTIRCTLHPSIKPLLTTPNVQ